MNSMHNEERETLSQSGLGSKTAAATPYVQLTLPSLKKPVSPKASAVPTQEPLAPESEVALTYGVGVDDSPEGTLDAAHVTWLAMIKRVYHKDPANPLPTYVDCSVHPSWHLYSGFKQWFDANHVAGYQLDKDILQPGNKTYSPDTCVFVPHFINQAVVWKRKQPKSGYHGVNAFAGQWYASLMHKGETTDGESRVDALEAHCDWLRMKADAIDDHLHYYLKETAPDLRVIRALIKYADLLRSNAEQSIPTLKYQH